MNYAAALALAAVATVTPTSTFPKGPIARNASHEIVRLDEVGSTLAGRRVTVNCWSNRDWRTMVAEQVRTGFARLA